MRRANAILGFILLAVSQNALAIFGGGEATTGHFMPLSETGQVWETVPEIANPEQGGLYEGTLTLIGLPGSEENLPIESQEWDYSKTGDAMDLEDSSAPPYLTTYTFKTGVHGMGRINIQIRCSGGTTSTPHNVGYFGDTTRRPDTWAWKPAQEQRREHAMRAKHQVIHAYEKLDGETYMPTPRDDCIPIANKGLRKEVLNGVEPMSATGTVYTYRIALTQGTQKQVWKKYGITAGSIPTPDFGWGESLGISWAWKFEGDPLNTWTIENPSYKSSFKVDVDHDFISDGDSETGHNCGKCDYCGASLKNKYAHVATTQNENGQTILSKCRVDATPAGCGKYIYKCDPDTERDEDELHKERECLIFVTTHCPSPQKLFRHCTNAYTQHQTKWLPHFDGSEPPVAPYDPRTETTKPTGLAPSDGSYTASAGDTIEANLVADGPYSQVYWYVKAPGETGYGTEVEIDTGDGSTSDASLSYTLPSDAAGEYTITAYIYRSDQSIYEESYTVTIAGLTSSDGSYTARAGGTHQANLVADGPYSQVYWYVRAPDETGYGTNAEIDTGDGSTSEASLSYTFPAGVTGEYTITAYIYRSDLSVYEESYTVTVESVIGQTGQ